MQPSLAQSSWPRFQEQHHFLLIQFSQNLKGTVRLDFCFEEMRLIFSRLILWTTDDLYPITQWVWHYTNALLHQQQFGTFSNIEKEFNFGIEKCRSCRGQGASWPWRPTASAAPQPGPPQGLGSPDVHWTAAPETDILSSWESTGKRAPRQACLNSPPA